MESTIAGELFRHRKSSSSERFLSLFSHSQSSSSLDDAVSAGDFDEHDIFWSGGDLSERPRRHPNPLSPAASSAVFLRSDNFGILTAMPDDDRNGILWHQTRPFLNRKASAPIVSSRAIPAIPKPQNQSEVSQSVPAGNFGRSAPVNVPADDKVKKRGESLADEEEDAEDELLPPHEIVAKSSGRSPWSTFSVLEGRGRTLKGRDLRQVRNAVFHKTGFLD